MSLVWSLISAREGRDLPVSLESRRSGEGAIFSGADGPALQQAVARESEPKLQWEGAGFQQPQRMKNNYICNWQPCWNVSWDPQQNNKPGKTAFPLPCHYGSCLSPGPQWSVAGRRRICLVLGRVNFCSDTPVPVEGDVAAGRKRQQLSSPASKNRDRCAVGDVSLRSWY